MFNSFNERNEIEIDYKKFFNNMNIGVLFCKIISNEKGNPIDFEIMEINSTLTEILELPREELLGELISKKMPFIEEESEDWKEKFREIMLDSSSITNNYFVKSLQKWISIEAYWYNKKYLIFIVNDVLKFIELEKNLKIQTENQDILLDTIETQIWFLKDTETYGRVNRAHAEFNGVTKDILMNKNLYDIFPKEIADICVEGNREVFETKKQIKTEEWVYKFGDTEKHLTAITKTPKIDSKGNVEYVVCSAEDITGRKTFEEALQESEELFRAIFESSSDNILLLDKKYTILFVNQLFCDFFQLSKEEIIGKNIWALSGFVSEIKNLWISKVKKTFDNGEIFDYTDEYKVEGTPIYLESKISPIFDSNNVIYAVTIIFHDITEKWILETALMKSQEQLMSFMDSAPDSFYLLDSKLNIIEVNRIALQKMRKKKLEVIGLNLTEIVPKSNKSGRINKYLEVIRTGEPYKINDLITDPINGDFHFTIQVFKVGDGLGLIGTDITEEKRLEAEREHLLDNLKEKTIILKKNIYERANAVEKLMEVNYELEEMKEKLAESNENLVKFAYIASHDLNEPLRMITSYLRLIERRYFDKLDDKGKKFIDIAVDGAYRMKNLIDGLLKYSRIGTQTRDFSSVDCEKIVKNVEENLHVVIQETETKILYENLPRVFGDSTQLLQLFQNFITNSIKFQKENKPIIQIKAEQKGKYWEFSVKDNGIGIDSKEFSKIFEIFQRLHTREEYKGTGIGMAVVKKIVERHKGKIWVESKLGVGSTFYFTIPVEFEREE